MTRAKTDPRTRGLDTEQTFINLARRLLSAQDSSEEQAALNSTIAMVLEVLFVANWRSGAIYRCANLFIEAEDEATRLGAIERLVATLDAGVAEMAEKANLAALATGLTQLLRKAGFTTREIAALVDDGRGGSAEQREGRAKTRLSGSVVKSLATFRKTAFVNGKGGARITIE